MRYSANKTITFLLLLIWAVLLVFAALTLISPLWLEKLSKPGKTVEAMTKKDYGDRFFDKGNYRQAIIQYKAALEIKPDMNSALSNMASAYYELGDLKNATRIYNHLLKKEPEHPDVVQANLAEVYEKAGNKELAIRHYEMAAKIAPDPVSAYQKAGKLYMDKGQYNKAIRNFLASIENRMNIENAYRAMLERELQRSEPGTEKQVYLDSIISNRKYLSILKYYDSTIFKQQLKNDRSLAKTYNNIGFCKYMLGDSESALRNFNKALEIHPGLTDAANNRRILLDILGTENFTGNK